MTQHSVKSTAIITALMIGAMAIISGCTLGEYGGYTKQYEQSVYDYGSRQKGDDKPVEGPQAYGKQIKGKHNHDNREYHYSKETSYFIGDLPGISQAYVFITDRNAYVGILLDDTASGLYRGEDRTEDLTDYTRYPKTQNTHPADPRRLAIGFDNPSTVEDHRNLSHELKQTIAVNIRIMHPQLLEVYISANQNYLNTLVQYSQDGGSAKGKHIKLHSFNAMVAKEFD